MGALYAQANIEVVFGTTFEQQYACESYGANMACKITKIIEVDERVGTSLAYVQYGKEYMSSNWHFLL